VKVDFDMEKKEASASVHETTASESCVKYFDAAWWCFTPTHQIQNYYINGDWDSCQETLSDLMRCFAGKTRLYTGEKPREKPSAIWKPRNTEEARRFWEAEFREVIQGTPDGDQER